MTDEQINVAIAYAIKWPGNIICRDYNGNLWPSVVPNYCIDLNAMHEAEKALDSVQINYYFDHLGYQIGEGFSKLHANARERAEAFLRTLGKWEEVQP